MILETVAKGSDMCLTVVVIWLVLVLFCVLLVFVDMLLPNELRNERVARIFI